MEMICELSYLADECIEKMQNIPVCNDRKTIKKHSNTLGAVISVITSSRRPINKSEIIVIERDASVGRHLTDATSSTVATDSYL